MQNPVESMDRRARHHRCMGRRGGGRRRPGGALVQALVVLAIIAVALAFLLPAASKVRGAATSTRCLMNLRGISAGLRMYAADSGNHLPYPAFTQIPWERSLARYAALEQFACPADQELAPATGSSYDWRDTGVPETTLAGRSPADARADAVLAFDALPGWHAKSQMNVVWADGSSGPLDAGACVLDLQRPIRAR